MKITGLDELQRQLSEASRAFQALDGDIATLLFDPADPRSIDAAIRAMERAIDSRITRYRGNQLVRSVADQMKDKYRQAIVERAAEARSTGESS